MRYKKILFRINDTLGGIDKGRPAYPVEGVLENWTSIVISIGTLLLNPDRQGRAV